MELKRRQKRVWARVSILSIPTYCRRCLFAVEPSPAKQAHISAGMGVSVGSSADAERFSLGDG